MGGKRWRCMLFLVGLLMVGWTEVWAKSGFLGQIDFGKITATEATQELATYYVDSFDLPSMQVRLTHELTCLATGEKLSGERLQIRGGDGSFYQLTQKALSLSCEGDATQRLLTFRVQLFPLDPPGVYESTLVIQNPEGQDLEEVQLCLEIKPWVLLRTEFGEVELADYQRNFSLVNRLPIILQIRANAPWKLYGICTAAPLVLQAGLKVTPLVESLTGVEVSPNQLFLSDRPQLMLSGQPTRFSKGSWLEIPILLRVADYKQLTAGEQELQVWFKVKTSGQSQSTF